MRSPIRAHFLSAGAALDRRRMEELFFQAAERLSNISGVAIADRRFLRSDFKSDTIAEMFFDSDDTTKYRFPNHNGHAPGTMIVAKSSDSFLEAELCWSMSCSVSSAALSRLVAWPVFGGEALWTAQKMAQAAATYGYDGIVEELPDPTAPVEVTLLTQGEKFTLGNKATYTGLAGAQGSGVLMATIGAVNVDKSSISIRFRNR